MSEAGTASPGDGDSSAALRTLTTAPESAEGVEAYQLLHRMVLGHLQRHWVGSLSVQDLEDVVADVLVKVVQRDRRDGAPPEHAGYLYAAARNAAIDLWRRQRSRSHPISLDTQTLGELVSVGDDDVAARFGGWAIACDVSRALDRIKDAGDRVAFIVVVAALDQTQRLGHRPSNRQLAESLGLSHTAVNKALARFRQLLESESTPR